VSGTTATGLARATRRSSNFYHGPPGGKGQRRCQRVMPGRWGIAGDHPRGGGIGVTARVTGWTANKLGQSPCRIVRRTAGRGDRDLQGPSPLPGTCYGACQGGRAAGTSGVVTSLTFRTRPATPARLLSSVSWPWSQAGRRLIAALAVTPWAPHGSPPALWSKPEPGGGPPRRQYPGHQGRRTYLGSSAAADEPLLRPQAVRGRSARIPPVPSQATRSPKPETRSIVEAAVSRSATRPLPTALGYGRRRQAHPAAASSDNVGTLHTPAEQRRDLHPGWPAHSWALARVCSVY